MHNGFTHFNTWKARLVSGMKGAGRKLVMRLTPWRIRLISLRTRALWHATVPLLWLVLGLLVIDNYRFAGMFTPHQFQSIAVALLYAPVAVVTAVLLLTPPRHWWLYLGATYVVQVALYTWFGYPLGFNLVAAVPTALEPLVTAYLLSRLLPLPPRFASVREVTLYIGCVALAATLSAFMGASLRASLGFAYWPAWGSWLLSNGLANVVLTPAIVLWATTSLRNLPRTSQWQVGERVLWGVLFLVVWVVELGVIWDNLSMRALIYLPVPLLLWAAVRFGPRGLTGGLALVTIVSVVGMDLGIGPFVGRSTPANVLTVQLFLGVVGIPLLFLAASVQQHEHMRQALRASEERYRGVVETQTEFISRSLPDTTLTFLNEAHCRYLGKTEEQLLGTKWLELVTDSARERVQAAIQSLLERPGISIIEHEAMLPDGSMRWQQWINRTICDADGTVTELQSAGRDITELKQAEAELAHLTKRLLHVQEEEWRRIARELHDGTAQNLSAMSLNLQRLAGILDTHGAGDTRVTRLLAETQLLGRQTIGEIRTLSYLLHPPNLEVLGLMSAIQWYTQGFSDRTGIQVQLVAAADLGRLPLEIEVALYRVVQEGLTNIHRHSGSLHVRIALAKRGRLVRLRIRDHGSGLTQLSAAAAAGDTVSHPETFAVLGVGIPGMRQRLRQLGGDLTIQSSPQGTTISASVPIAAHVGLVGVTAAEH
jgi:two-component system, NarL family, sensor kinase